MDNTFSESIEKLLKQYPEQRMRASLLQIFIDFIRYQDQQGTIPTNIYTLLNDIEALFELLEIMERHERTLK